MHHLLSLIRKHFLNDFIINSYRDLKMMNGKVIINFQSNDDGTCDFNINQEGGDRLDNETLIALFEHIISELYPV
jgi:hypothetical protein